MKFYIEEIICFVVAFGFWIYSLVLLLNGSNMDTGLTEAVIAGSVTLVVAVVTGTVAIYRASKNTDSKLGKAEGTLSKEHTELRGDLSKEHTELKSDLKLGNSEIIGNLSNKHTELKGDLSKLAIVSDDVKSSVGKVGDSVLLVKDTINEEKLKREALHSMFTSREHDINETMKEFSEFMADWEGKINENAKLKQDKLILEGKMSDMREKLSVLEALSELPERLEAASAENALLSEKLVTAESVRNDLQSRLRETVKELETASAEITMLSEKLVTAESARNDFQSRLYELEQSQEDENEI